MWPSIKLADICSKITDGSHNPPKGIDYSEHLMLSSKNVFDDHIHIDKPRYLSGADFDSENKRTDVCVDDVLLTIVGTIGRVGVVDKSLPKFTLQRSVAVLKPLHDAVSSRFLMYSLQNILEQLLGKSRGVAQKGLYLKTLRDINIQLPPIPEQKRIVAILDQAFADIEKARANAEQNLKNARELFDSFLQQVFSQRGEGRVETSLGNEVELLTGYAFKSKDYTEAPQGIPLIRGDNIVQGKIRWDGVKRWPKDDAPGYTKYQLEKGDVLLAMDRTWVKAGMKYAKISNNDLPSLLVQRVARMRVHGDFNEDYLFHLLGSKLFESYVLSIQTGLGVPHISGKQIAGFQFQKPTFAAQNEIVLNINRLAAEAERLEVCFGQKLTSLEELKKSLLQKAFSGELTKEKGVAA